MSKFDGCINKLTLEKEKIQNQFDFILPDYIIDEIISHEDDKNYFNLHSLINLAIVNKRISIEQANIIKCSYKKA